VLRDGPDIISVAEQATKKIDYAAEVHFALGDAIGFDWLRQRAERIVTADHWDVLAVRSLLEDLSDQQRSLALAVCTGADKKSAAVATRDWLKAEQTRIIRATRLVDELKTSGALSVSKLSFAARHLRSILR